VLVSYTHLVVIGVVGAGKSDVAGFLAERLGWAPVIDPAPTETP
jgi:adenylate kinase family enzyme